MKIRMTSMAFTPYGVFEKGTVLTEKDVSKEFMCHLCTAAGAAEVIEEDKIETAIIEPEIKPQPRRTKKKASKKKFG